MSSKSAITILYGSLAHSVWLVNLAGLDRKCMN